MRTILKRYSYEERLTRKRSYCIAGILFDQSRRLALLRSDCRTVSIVFFLPIYSSQSTYNSYSFTVIVDKSSQLVLTSLGWCWAAGQTIFK